MVLDDIYYTYNNFISYKSSCPFQTKHMNNNMLLIQDMDAFQISGRFCGEEGHKAVLLYCQILWHHHRTPGDRHSEVEACFIQYVFPPLNRPEICCAQLCSFQISTHPSFSVPPGPEDTFS